ncbi:hypothetical protein [Streptomyces djakartensis]|uniref:Serine/threonine protein kinase n=1 Tax=Streptomyces djakartensis TaxID=68193 RepID=A0ABQ2Z3Z2_9ACTN|nr:hypothetical protein [Streptomyces djakartensis]GGY02726.1 hypothetical protein GCM10010384_03320 [Streptomyces djakartensis]
MSGGQRYWNEETQRWEDGGEGAAQVTPPPPPRPDFTPLAPHTADRHDSGTWSASELPQDPPPGGAWPPAGPTAPVTAPVPAAVTRRYSRRLVWSVLGGAAAVGIVAALVLTLSSGGDGTDDRGDGAPSVSPTADGSTSTTEGPEPTTEETASPSDPATELPAGYELYEDAEGFTIARPVDWKRKAEASQHGMDVVSYRSSDAERRVQVFEVAEASPDESFELFLSDETPKAEGFRKLDLNHMNDGDVTAARLAYLADSIDGEPEIGTWHVVDERFVAPDGKVYAIVVYGSDADGRDDEHELLDIALAHFCPPNTTCGPQTGAETDADLG